MEFNEIKKLVEYYEDKIIINFEKYFSELVLMDFYEGGFEGRLADELYYEEYLEEYENGIIDLLLLIENEFSDEYQDFKMRLIKMKRVIDTKLSTVTLLSDEEKTSRTIGRKNQFLINSEIDKDKFITSLFDKLSSNNLINASFEIFKNHFLEKQSDKILWLGTELQITNLFSRLIEIKILDPETVNFKNKLIAYHFSNKSNKIFKEKQLGAVYSEKKESIPKDDIINKIIEEMSTHL